MQIASIISEIESNEYMKQTILITGASSGFGLIVATKLHESGYQVIGTSRNPNQSKVPFKMLSLDIADDSSIKVFRNELFKHISKLDVLVNNAGFYLSGLAEETSVEEGCFCDFGNPTFCLQII